jgi:hypothetical protein
VKQGISDISHRVKVFWGRRGLIVSLAGGRAMTCLNKRSHILGLFVDQTCVPGVFVRIRGYDFLVGAPLNFLTVWRRQVCNCHVDVSGKRVEACGYHCEADGFKLI